MIEAWELVREMIEGLDICLTFESDHSLLHLYYSEPLHGDSVLWLLGEYVDLVESHVSMSNQKLSRSSFLSHIRTRWLQSQHVAMPPIGFIPGLSPSGVG